MSGKLIRDRVPELFGWAGVRPLDADTFRAALRDKLMEETAEYLRAETPAERGAELADVLEVLLALAAQDGLTPADLEAQRAATHADRGGFEHRLWWDG